MKWVLDLSTRSKLLLGFGLMALFLAIVVGVAYRSLTAMQAAQNELFEVDFANALDLMLLRTHENAVRTDVLTIIAAPWQAEQERARADITERGRQIEAITRRLGERNAGDARLLRRFDELNTVREAYARARDTEVLPLILAGKLDEAKPIVFGAQEQRQAKLRELVRTLGDEAVTHAQENVAASHAQADAARHAFLLAALLALGAAAAMVFYLERIIARPLVVVSALAGRVATGDLAIALPADGRRDEVGVLAASFRGMVESLRGVNSEIRDGVGVLGSSASEILASTTQVASGAAETAAAVGQTTTTLEEVKQTAQVSNQKAQYVSDAAQRVAQVSQAGRKAVEDAAAGMHKIREQMESVAGSILRLSEQSQSIGEIIATVNDLAEQSNLLAVNAAIEAAKAGEHGRGFGVVAQEVKSLAEQSKQATAQVRAILGDIQKATSGAVMATEQGSKAVAAGLEQSAKAGEAIRLLADSVMEAAQASTQIAASSQQQLLGMDQVALAMENIRQATTQNVASTRQVERAAQDLHELGQRLKQSVERYKV